MAISEDRRIQRTRKALIDSLRELIFEKGYDDISIQDITDRANMGRATFYLHYGEKDDLLSDLLHNVVREFIDSTPEILKDYWNLQSTIATQKIFEFAASQYDLFRKAIFSKGSFVAMIHLQIAIREIISANLNSEMKNKNLEPVLPQGFIENYYSGALVALILWWLNAEMPYTPAEMAEMYRKITLEGRTKLLRPKTETASGEIPPKSERPESSSDEPTEGNQTP
jgi:AcrR family transcriptional regulator